MPHTALTHPVLPVQPQVMDPMADWTLRSYAFGPVKAAVVPRDTKVSGIIVRPRPNGSVLVSLDLSAPKGRTINDGIDKTVYPPCCSLPRGCTCSTTLAGMPCPPGRTRLPPSNTLVLRQRIPTYSGSPRLGVSSKSFAIFLAVLSALTYLILLPRSSLMPSAVRPLSQGTWSAST